MGIAILTGLFVFASTLTMPEFLTLWKINPEFYNDPNFAIPVGLVIIVGVYHLLQALLEMFVFMPMRMAVQLIPLRRAADKSA